MNADNIDTRIATWARSAPRVFTWKDCRHFGTREVIEAAFRRLTQAGKLRRVSIGMYDVPRMSKLLGKHAAPSIDHVIEAIMRNDGVTIVPADMAAANALGLTTAVLVKPHYRTSGKHRSFKVGNRTVQLTPAGRDLADWIDTPAAIAIQALLFLGSRSGSEPRAIKALRNGLSVEAKHALCDQSRYRPKWMQPVIEQVTTDML